MPPYPGNHLSAVSLEIQDLRDRDILGDRGLIPQEMIPLAWPWLVPFSLHHSTLATHSGGS